LREAQDNYKEDFSPVLTNGRLLRQYSSKQEFVGKQVPIMRFAPRYIVP